MWFRILFTMKPLLTIGYQKNSLHTALRVKNTQHIFKDSFGCTSSVEKLRCVCLNVSASPHVTCVVVSMCSASVSKWSKFEVAKSCFACQPCPPRESLFRQCVVLNHAVWLCWSFFGSFYHGFCTADILWVFQTCLGNFFAVARVTPLNRPCKADGFFFFALHFCSFSSVHLILRG